MVADVGLYEQFKMTPIGTILTDNRYNRLREQMIDTYLTDFVYMSHPCVNTTEHKVPRISYLIYFILCLVYGSKSNQLVQRYYC